MNADGSDPVRLTDNDVSDSYPVWSPDGSRIAFVSGSRWNTINISVMNADGSDQTRLTDIPVTNIAVDELSPPAWSPDGKRIAYVSIHFGGNWHPDFIHQEVSVMNSDGSNQARLTETPLMHHGVMLRDKLLAWSPDGPRISYFRRDRETQIYVVNAGGAGQTRLTDNDANDYSPAWSPDGKRIAFASDRDGGSEIYVMDSDGSNQTRLTANPRIDFDPTWSHDGRWIAFVSYHLGIGEIYVVRPDGSELTQITNNDSDDRSPTWAPR